MVRQSVLNGLAVAGFIALVALGIWLAVYSTRFVPGIVNEAGEAAVYLGSLFTRAPEPTVLVDSTSTPSSTISLNGNTASSNTSTIKPKSGDLSAGAGKSNTYQIGGTVPAGPLTGLPDLVVEITSVGYLETASTDSFVASSTAPLGSRPAVRFTIRNIGTNTAGSWRFNASIPTRIAFFFQSQPQQPLKPGERIDYTLGFDQGNSGTNQTIIVTANFDHAIGESNTNNNSDSAKMTIL
jgi:hypothetical protein